MSTPRLMLTVAIGLVMSPAFVSPGLAQSYEAQGYAQELQQVQTIAAYVYLLDEDLKVNKMSSARANFGQIAPALAVLVPKLDRKHQQATLLKNECETNALVFQTSNGESESALRTARKNLNTAIELLRKYFAQINKIDATTAGLPAKRDTAYNNFKRLSDKIDNAESNPLAFWNSFDVVANNDVADANNYLRTYKGLVTQLNNLAQSRATNYAQYDYQNRLIKYYNAEISRLMTESRSYFDTVGLFKNQAATLEDAYKNAREAYLIATNGLPDQLKLISDVIGLMDANDATYEDVNKETISLAKEIVRMEEQRKTANQILLAVGTCALVRAVVIK
ncbi:MAG: hypothetical protein JKY49_14580 [Cohaesibacteraceae bacterium]|nr:hypothetical protein [Cohaesibacteraceae bacterium]